MAVAPMIDLDPGDTLAGLELLVKRRRRAVEIDDLLLVGHWWTCSPPTRRDDPLPDPTVPLPPGSDRLVRLGGGGTPRVRELTLSSSASPGGARLSRGRWPRTCSTCDTACPAPGRCSWPVSTPGWSAGSRR